MKQFKIDKEFENKIPPMPKEDFDGLRADIIADGYVRDPLVVWTEENTLVDGHHRWQIIQDNYELLKDKYTVAYRSFPDRWAAIAWICANQLHKHNMTEIQRMKLIQEEHDARQKSWGGDRKSSGEILHLKPEEPEPVKHGSSGKELKTRPTIAKEHGITEGAVKAAVEVGRGIDKAEKVAPGFKNKVLSGEVKANKGDLAAMRKMDDDKIKEAVENIYSGMKPDKPKPEKPKSPGYTKADRELHEIIQKSVASQTNYDVSSAYNIDDLIQEIEINGNNYINSLKNTLEHRKDIAKDGDAKNRVSQAISKIIQDIVKVRGEFIK